MEEQGAGAPVEEPAIPLGQRIYDNTFLLLAAGLLVMFVLYTLWGLVEVIALPEAPLP